MPNCIACGPGILYLAHQPDECCSIDGLVNATEVLAPLDLTGRRRLITQYRGVAERTEDAWRLSRWRYGLTFTTVTTQSQDRPRETAMLARPAFGGASGNERDHKRKHRGRR